MAKRALLVGCNYPGTKAELSGCVGDVYGWKSLLEDCCGFNSEDITILIDTDAAFTRPTGKNIKEELKRLVTESQDGDTLFLHFSGHGVQVPDDDPDEEADGMDEALCPCDFNLIIDDDMREIIEPLNPGCKFIFVSDCCHSGGMLDHKEVVISGEIDDVAAYGDSQKAREIVLGDAEEVGIEQVNRAITFETLSDLLGEQAAEKVKREEGILKKTRNMLFRIFGKDSSNVAAALTKSKSSHYSRAGAKPPEELQIDPNKGILVTGCQATETSADVTYKDGRSFGALSDTFQTVIRKHRLEHPGKPITFRQAVLQVRKMLSKKGFTQHPCLECSETNADTPFLEP